MGTFAAPGYTFSLYQSGLLMSSSTMLSYGRFASSRARATLCENGDSCTGFSVNAPQSILEEHTSAEYRVICFPDIVVDLKGYVGFRY